MLESYVAAALLGVIAGLRTLTAPAVFWLERHRSPVAYFLGFLAFWELAADLHPSTPARTGLLGLSARVISGAFCGGAVMATVGGSLFIGALLGAIGAVVGAYAGLAARIRAIALIGRIPAALLEDAIAIAGAIAIVTELV
ncbi:MAG: hypothetical protein WB757_09285 [Candidatus Cybelea sp.]|jgi:uncharacterized membrane protein